MNVPNNPIIPFIEGDGIGPDIWAAASRVLEAAVEKLMMVRRKSFGKKCLQGKAFNQTGEWLPEETLNLIREYLIAIKGPLTTPVGGGIRSLNVALRQELDLYVCLRPVRYFEGVPSPVKRPKILIWLFSVKIQKTFMLELNMHKDLQKQKSSCFLKRSNGC